MAQKNLTKGNVGKTLVWFALPFLASFFLQTLYGMADLYIIGQYGTVADTTAVSVGSQIMHMVTVMIVGLSMGSTVMIGRAVGAEDKKATKKALGNTLTLFLPTAIGITLLLQLLMEPIVRVMSTPKEAVYGTTLYLRICFAGIPLITAYNIIAAVFRGMGDSKSPLVFISIACVFNIVLDYLFMGALAMGTAGAALGTTISQGISVWASVFWIRKKNRIKLEKEDIRPEKKTMGSLLRIGLPICAQDGFIQIAFILITIFGNRRGLSDAAAIGIVEKIICFLFLVPSSMLSSVSALSAQNLGAGKPERAKATLRSAVLIAAAFGLAVSIATQFIADEAVALFTDDAVVIQRGGQYLRSYVWDTVMAGIHFSFSGYFSALGRSEISFMQNLISVVAVRIPLSYWASVSFPNSLTPMGSAAPAGSALSAVICLIAYWVLERKVRKKR